MGRALFAALWFLIAVPLARADIRILASPGGEVGTYLELFSLLRQSGQRVVIDGPCFSSCTLVLSTIILPTLPVDPAGRVEAQDGLWGDADPISWERHRDEKPKSSNERTSHRNLH